MSEEVVEKYFHDIGSCPPVMDRDEEIARFSHMIAAEAAAILVAMKTGGEIVDPGPGLNPTGIKEIRSSPEGRAWKERLFNHANSVLAESDDEWAREWVGARSTFFTARNACMLSNLKLVFKVANGFRRRSTSMGLPDLIQEGNIGLVRAVAGFDPDRGTRFSTYATYWIRQNMARAFDDIGRTIRIPPHAALSVNSVAKFRSKFMARYGEEPDDMEIMKSVDVNATVLSATLLMNVSSADKTDEVGLSTLDKTAGDIPSPDFDLDMADKAARVERILSVLNENERATIELRFGMRGDDEMLISEVARARGISSERVRQIEGVSMKKMRKNA